MKREFLLHLLSPLNRSQQEYSTRQLFVSFIQGINIFKSRKNWIYFTNIFMSVAMIIPTYFFFTEFFTWKLMGFVILMNAIIFNVYSTLYYHRYCSHKAFKVRNKAGLFILKNLVPKMFMEEIFTIAHQVHHKYSDSIDDPHNAKDGFLFNYISDVTMMRLNPNLSQSDYKKALSIFSHTGIKTNSYEEYLKWGSISNPLTTSIHIILNWTFFALLFLIIGGLPLMLAVFTGAFFWGLSVRNFNFKSHGGGEDRRKNGRDFDHDSLGLNLILPGTLCGEWHSTHHIYPTSANLGFCWWQLDLTFQVIKVLKIFCIVTEYIDKKELFEKVYLDDKTKAFTHDGKISHIA